jgi:L-cysteine desulfidase
MRSEDETYKAYLNILESELIPSMGCTEPAALAFAAASAREVLGEMPDRVFVEVSGNILKNAKSVIIPNTKGMKGIPTAVAAGIVAGRAQLGLELISKLTEEDRREIRVFLETHVIEVAQARSDLVFDIKITLLSHSHKVCLRICDRHTDIVYIEKDGAVISDRTSSVNHRLSREFPEYDLLNVKEIIDFADTVAPDDVSALIERQLALNTAVADEGLKNNYGANIGKILLAERDGDVQTRAKAMAAAASDARMSGCEMPVIILSGSGNQGITAALPVAEYAKDRNADRELLIRAVVLSDLITLHLKRHIGRLSAYCGAVCAGAACGAGIAYLCGGRYREIAHTIVNALAITSGMLCDGAKPSCAAKIAMSVEAGIMGYRMFCAGQEFYSGEGLVKADVEETIKSVGVIGRVGMRATDATVIDLMLEDIK